MKNKHKPPLTCYLRRALVGGSPSAIFARCSLGLKHRCPKCKGCTANVVELWQENFDKGIKEDIKEDAP